jgi:hypothetical protein
MRAIQRHGCLAMTAVECSGEVVIASVAKQSSAETLLALDCFGAMRVEAFIHMKVSPSMPPASQAERPSAMTAVAKPLRNDGWRAGIAKCPRRLLPPPFGGGIAETGFCAVLPLAGGVPLGFAGLSGRRGRFSGDLGGFP